MTDTSSSQTQDSYLHEAQKSGKSSGDMAVQNLDNAINSVHEIMNEEVVAHFKSAPEEEWGTLKLAVYCHDCHAIVPPRITKVRGKTRAICGTCNSRKISMGREEALKQFYHLEK